MNAITMGLVVIATEGGEIGGEFIPPTDWRAQIALPAMILIFFGGIFLLLRSNLGTRRAYLVEATSFFGFMVALSLFWTFGAPGTPRFTGPQNLPGQAQDYYQPKWIPFAQSSLLADEPEYAIVKQFPEGFSEPPEERIDFYIEGADAARAFFAEDHGGVTLIGETWTLVEGSVQAAESEGGQDIASATYAPTYQLDASGEIPVNQETGEPEFAEDQAGQIIPEGEPIPGSGEMAEHVTVFAFFDPGFPAFPSYVFVVLSVIGFLLHLALLMWDENRERRETAEDRQAPRERVPAGV